MSATAIMIVSACMGFSGVQKDACEKSLEAAGKQSGIEQNINTAEKKITKDADDKARKVVGDTGVGIVGSTLYVAKVVRDKNVQFNTPNFGICDRITNEVWIDKYSVKLEWRF